MIMDNEMEVSEKKERQETKRTEAKKTLMVTFLSTPFEMHGAQIAHTGRLICEQSIWTPSSRRRKSDHISFSSLGCCCSEQIKKIPQEIIYVRI